MRVRSYLRRFLTFAFVPAVLVCALADIAVGRNAADVGLRDPDARRRAVERLADKHRQRKDLAVAIAKSHGWPVKQQIGDTLFELMAVEDGRVYVYKT